MRIAVCLPTFGRASLVRRAVERLVRQSRRPDAVLVSAPDESHVERGSYGDLPVVHVFGERGASAQRNRALREVCGTFEAVVFFDDDFVPADDYLDAVAAAYEAHPDWIVLTGRVLRDGIHDAGVEPDEAERIVATSRAVPLRDAEAQDWHGGYGCNMAIRLAHVGEQRFDERLVLYGWLEDLDFTRRVANGGRIIRLSSLRGVHLGTKAGRVSGAPLGYSQVVNPLYLARKGSVTPLMAVGLIGRNVLANAGRLLMPEPWVDRRGRLRGNLIAIRHLLGGRAAPERAAELVAQAGKP